MRLKAIQEILYEGYRRFCTMWQFDILYYGSENKKCFIEIVMKTIFEEKLYLDNTIKTSVFWHTK